MEFYSIYEQTGLQEGQEGIFGIAPLTSRASKREIHDSFVFNLKNEGVVPRAVVGLYISPNESKNPHEIQIGDYDEKYVSGGEVNLKWLPLIKQNKWMVELTDSYFGDDVLFTHFFKPAELNFGFEGFGLQKSDFTQVKKEV